MSDEEDFGIGAGGPMVVEVKGRSSSATRSSPRRRSPTNYDSDEYSEDDTWSAEEDVYTDEETVPHTQRSQRRSQRTPRKNGRSKIDMTPPDKKLKIAEKKAVRFTESGKVDKVITELTKCLALNRILYGAGHWKLARSHANLAEAYLDLKAYAVQAEYHTENAKSIMLNSVTSYTTDQEKADIYDVLFKIYYIQGRALATLKKYNEADQMLAKTEKVIGELNKLSCVDDNQLDDYEIKLSQATARLYWKQKKYAVATSQYDKLLKLMEDRYGEDSVHLIPVYQECGKLEQSKGRYSNHERAIDMFLQAHSIAGSHYKDGHSQLIETSLALAQAYSSTGDEDGEAAAEKYLNECLATCQTIHGPHHKQTLTVQDELARLYIRTDRNAEALSLLSSSVKDKCDVFGDYSENVSDTYKMMASIYLAQGNIQKALKTYKKCHDIECLVLGKGHKKSKDTERTIDILMATPGISNNFVLSKGDELKKRPKFNAIVKGSKNVGGFKTSFD
ncbi:tetratricopeptide repeat protein 23-like [Saccostrea echinata]|uniref:tetratricopeptide repeat protein 23-like n=1 Tax=Saccostrea echinata TaxID=191078 RepID=UPI002A820CFF|nr:tetratricopeptide repeat protein 23-like [Saccostrea echinata]XP_061180717.1 tetratricopeptide repeat protein 23-like [Saccostrea echinata]